MACSPTTAARFTFSPTPARHSNWQKKGGESPKNKYTLFKIDLPRKKAEALLSLDQKGDAALVLYGDPLEGMSVVVVHRQGPKLL